MTDDGSAIEQTDSYLVWLDAHLRDRGIRSLDGRGAASGGPRQDWALAVFADEYQRSVEHLYPTMELDALSKGHVEQTLD